MIRPIDAFRATYWLALKHKSRAYGYELWQYDDFSCDHGKYGEGSASVTLDPRSNDIPWTDVLSDLYGWSLDMGILNSTKTLWKGPVLQLKFAHGLGTRITLECETFMHHLARRRIGVSTNNAKLSDAVTQVYAGDMLETIWGLALENPSTVSGYPWTERDVMTPWTAVLGTADNGNQFYMENESGSNLWDFTVDMCERGDLYTKLTESPAGTFQYDFASPYAGTDRSAYIVFTNRNGLLRAVQRTIDFSALCNTFQFRGSGKEDGQVIYWYGNTPSKTTYGIFEDGDTEAGADDTNTGGDLAEYLAKGDPIQTWEIDVVADDEYRFGIDFAHRDLISFHHTDMEIFGGLSGGGGGGVVTGRVIGWKCGFEAGRAIWTFVLGEPPRNYLGELWQRVGMAGGRMAAGVRRTKGGW